MWQWKKLGDPAPSQLVDARLQLHHAAQLVAAVGLNLLEARPDDSHPNMEWRDSLGGLAGRLGGSAHPVQAALELDQLRLLLLDERGAALRDLDLPERTLDEAYAWLGASIEEAPRPLERTRYELPAHPVASSATFRAEPAEAFAELGRWYHNAHHLLEESLAVEPGATEVRCWPHHFDLGALIVLDPNEDPEKARSIGVGMSPGDASYPLPYFYVNPWPYPDSDSLPRLAEGAVWHTQGWVGAVLPGSTLVDAGDATAQREQAETYLRSALAGCHLLLDPS